jgi:RecA-family ATPase
VGRQVAIFSPPKEGKSLLALDVCAAAATGGPILGRPASEPLSVVYIDYEMTPDDLRERLERMGYRPDSHLENLHYYQLVDLPPLDSATGGQVLKNIVRRWDARLVVLDTMARVVCGEEN